MTMPAQPPTKSTTPTGEVEPATQKFDRFHPAMPHIPGVGSNSGKRSRSLVGIDVRRLAQMGGIAAAVLVFIIAMLSWFKTSQRTALESSAPDATDAESPIP